MLQFTVVLQPIACNFHSFNYNNIDDKALNLPKVYRHKCDCADCKTVPFCISAVLQSSNCEESLAAVKTTGYLKYL